MSARLSVIAALALMATPMLSAANAAPMSFTSSVAAGAGSSPVEAVRLVCDQNCNCWHTAYRAPRHATVWYADDVNACPAGGRYNGHYRTGPSTGLGFESRIAKGTLFPFY